MEQIDHQKNHIYKEIYCIGNEIYQINERMSYLKNLLFIIREQYSKEKSEIKRLQYTINIDEYNKLLYKKKNLINQRNEKEEKIKKLDKEYKIIIKNNAHKILYNF